MLEAIVSRLMTLAITAGLATAPAASPSVAATTATAVVREVGATVHMHGSAFVPARAVIHAGEAVAFENDDDVAHDATAADGSFATPRPARSRTAAPITRSCTARSSCYPRKAPPSRPRALDSELAKYLASYMRQVSTFDAKNRLSELLDAVAAGESIEILRRGKPAARLVPVPAPGARFATPSEAANWLRTHRTEIPSENLRALIEEGRR